MIYPNICSGQRIMPHPLLGLFDDNDDAPPTGIAVMGEEFVF